MYDRVLEKRHGFIVAALMVSLGLLSSACDGGKEPLRDAGTFCGTHDGRTFPVGAVFSDGCGCCTCNSLGWSCYGGNQCTRLIDGGIQSLMSIPPCQSDDDCSKMVGAGAVCVFDPGCSPGQGRCVSNPSSVCAAYASDIAHDYCGCDGQTFHVGVSGAKNYPDRTYAQIGPCP
jgi:hypothetical protein